MFPTGFKGEIETPPLRPQDVDDVLASIEEALVGAKAADITRVGNTISFRGGLFRFVIGNWNVLHPVGHGEIEVVPGSPGAVRYDLSCVQMLVVATLMVGWLTVSMSSRGHVTLGTVLIPLIGWLWLFGMNYLIAAVRLPAFVRSAISPQGPDSRACPVCGKRYFASDYRPDASERRCSGCHSLLDEPGSSVSV